MLRALRVLLIAIVLLPSALDGAAQEGDAAYFESLEGLERVVARSWMAPVTVTIVEERSEDLDEQGTPIPGTLVISTPAASPAPLSGVGMLSIFVFLFDTDANAAAGWERLDRDLQKTVERDPRAPMMEDLALDTIGDHARGFMGSLDTGDVTTYHTFATIQSGPFVYSIAGTFAGTGGADLTRQYAGALVSAPMDRMAEQFNPDGSSRGGIWRKLNAVQPALPEGSTVTDLEIWPIPEGAVKEPAEVTMDEIGAMPGVEGIAGTTYLPGREATGAGPTRIDAWIVETSSVEEGSLLVYAVADALGSPIAVIASENGFEDNGEETEVLVALEGFVTDDAMPEGNASVVVRQVGTTIYAAVVYAPDDTTRRVADNVVGAMIGAPGEDMHARFPVEGDGVLRGLVPAGPLPATPVATPGANAGPEFAGEPHVAPEPLSCAQNPYSSI